MRMLWSVAIAVSAATVVLGQRPARIGPDGKPLLNRPVMEECQKSEWKNHEKKFFDVFQTANIYRQVTTIGCVTFSTVVWM